ncbi:class I SAM-dependent methyltransferase [Amycolatopsis saalfeldensis]|uniref:Methyltransferase domain-containing protein n=1 Tax=Amycolatopsis saalfeldensis TaxID=394193 RepID=A0A1H8YJS4_9PSEU|nr:class I SAM-dependent methyltransferase [Amycolatopsis saalfeldensis]SEP52406.1 Methyltransferase domain-containing protein [Amycolatopsis saalfeldensis]
MQYAKDHAELYDLVFRSRGKDFAAEAEALTELARSRFPAARSLLDVACGTGAHLETFRHLFDEVAGFELAEAMRAVAQARLPDVPIHAGDMRRLELGRSFDVLVCMGNSVACMPDPADLDTAIAGMAAHVVPGGVVIVEPWWFPADFIDGYVDGHLMKENDRVVSRITRSVREGGVTRMEVKFTVADASGITDFTDLLQVTLFERDDYRSAFERAGCTVEFVPGLRLASGRPNSPGLFVGTRK